MFLSKKRCFTFFAAILTSFFLSGAAAFASTSISAGQSAKLSVSAAGTSPFSYQWYKDGAAISGATASSYSISSMSTVTAGVYQAKVLNSAGSTMSDQATLVVVSLITFTTQPQSKTAAVGSSVTFTAVASGVPAPTYQWKKNGTAISGATGSSYTVSNITTGSAGTYTVVATNSLGSATSNGAVLTVTTASGTSSAPAFTTQPMSNTVTVGNAVTFTAAVSGSPTPTYQWRKDGVNISGATNASYTISSAASSSAGTYTLVATNSAGSATSNGAVLTVSAATTSLSIWSGSTTPSQVDSGADNLVELGVKFKSDVAGTIAGVRFYKSTANSGTHVGNLWSASGTLLATASFSGETASGWQQVNFSSPVTIAANTVYVVSYFCPVGHYSSDVNYFSTKGGDNAPLHALANGISGTNGVYGYGSKSVFPTQSWNSSNYWVDVVFKPTVTATVTLTSIAVTPANTTVTVGATQQFIATGTYSNATTQDLSTQVGWSSSKPTVATINATTGRVTATAVAGTSTISATLSGVTGSTTLTTVASAPSFTTQPASKTVAVGGSVTFTAAASGSPAPTYQWAKNGANISGATSASYTIASVSTGSAGTYTVIASNSAGTKTSNGAVLTVTAATSAPVFTTQPASKTVTAGSSVTFTAAASGSPTPTYQWRRNGASISGATAASYIISSVSSSNTGTYTVVATNSQGSVTSTGAVLAIAAATPISGQIDFNSDKQTDIVWQNVANGQWEVWLMSGTEMDNIITLGTFDKKLQVNGAADFNADGKADLLVQDDVSGQCSIWLMSGSTVTSKIVLSTEDTDWQMRGAGDFNGDGKPDIVWQNTSTGDCVVWLMSGTKLSSIVTLGTFSTATEICGIGDFNADGKPDIVWQNILTGQRSVWLMSGTTVSSKVTIGTFSTDWQISGAGDFNADGKCDLLMQNIATGECDIWLMSGTTITTKLFLSSEDASWVIKN